MVRGDGTQSSPEDATAANEGVVEAGGAILRKLVGVLCFEELVQLIRTGDDMPELESSTAYSGDQSNQEGGVRLEISVGLTVLRDKGECALD